MMVTLRLTDECVKTNIDHRLLKRYLAGYSREKKRDKVHRHIQFSRDVPCAFYINSEAPSSTRIH